MPDECHLRQQQHLREDRRHIQDDDVTRLCTTVRTVLNLEMACTAEMVAIAERLRPYQVTFVPERREEVTTEGGLDVSRDPESLRSAIQRLADTGVRTSLFIDPDIQQIKTAAKLGAFQIEICTAQYAHLNEQPGDQTVRRTAEIEKEVARIQAASKAAIREGLKVAVGHGLTYRNVGAIARIPEIEEFNIGHNIIARAALVGLDRAVREMIAAIGEAQGKWG